MSENGRRTLYMVAGLYLVYSGGNLTLSVVRGEAESTTVMLAAGIVFILAGIFLIVDYIRYRRKSFLQRDIEQEDTIQTIEEEVVDSEKEEE